jgi:hypothetical protein
VSGKLRGRDGASVGERVVGSDEQHRIARTLSAWSIGQQASIAVLTALGGLLADITSPRTALTVAGLLILASPLLLPRRQRPGRERLSHSCANWHSVVP